MHWEEFLKQPGKGSFIDLEEEIITKSGHCSWGNPKNHEVVSVEEGQQLFKLIEKGDEFSFKAGLLVMHCLDGGELEDFHRSAGQFFEVKPSVFMKIVDEKKIPDLSIKSMLTMLPLDTVDHIDRAVSVVERRISILEAIDDSQFDNLKRIGLSYLTDEKAMLTRVMN